MTPSDKSGGRFAALLCPLREGLTVNIYRLTTRFSRWEMILFN